MTIDVRYKIVPIGNSRGVRLPKHLITEYGLIESVNVKEVQQLSWEETYQDMSATDEGWSDWVELDLEGLDADR